MAVKVIYEFEEICKSCLTSNHYNSTNWGSTCYCGELFSYKPGFIHCPGCEREDHPNYTVLSNGCCKYHQ